MVYITRKEHFNAAHRIHVAAWSDEKNEEVFGKCANRNFHGHNFDLYITVKGEPDPQTGFVMNVKELGAIMKREIVQRFDHKNLNLDLEYFKHTQPSIENMVKVIWDLMEPQIQGCVLHAVKLQETENIYAEYFGN